MTCSHNNKYTTGFGKITYDYCPDCKEEVVVNTVEKKEDYVMYIDESSSMILPNDGIYAIPSAGLCTIIGTPITPSDGNPIGDYEASASTVSVWDKYYPRDCFMATAPVEGWKHITTSRYNYLADVEQKVFDLFHLDYKEDPLLMIKELRSLLKNNNR